jgi:hypothetical protein
MFYFFSRLCLLIFFFFKLRFFRKIIVKLVFKRAYNFIRTSLSFWKFFENKTFMWLLNRLNFCFLSFNKLLAKGKLSIHSLWLLVFQIKDHSIIWLLFLFECYFILSVALLFQYILLRNLIILNSYIVSPSLFINS